MSLLGWDVASVVQQPSLTPTSVWLPDPTTFTWDTTTGTTYVNDWKEMGAGTKKLQSTTWVDRATYSAGVAGVQAPGVRSPSNHTFQLSLDTSPNYVGMWNSEWSLAFTYTVVANPTTPAAHHGGIWAVRWPTTANFVLFHRQDAPFQMVYTNNGGGHIYRDSMSVPCHRDTKIATHRNVLLTCVFSWHPSLNRIVNVGDNGLQTNTGPSSRRYQSVATSADSEVYTGLSDAVDLTNALGHQPTTWPRLTADTGTAYTSGNGWIGNNFIPLRLGPNRKTSIQLMLGGSNIVTPATCPDMYLHEVRLWDWALDPREAVQVYSDIRNATLGRIPP